MKIPHLPELTSVTSSHIYMDYHCIYKKICKFPKKPRPFPQSSTSSSKDFYIINLCKSGIIIQIKRLDDFQRQLSTRYKICKSLTTFNFYFTFNQQFCKYKLNKEDITTLPLTCI